jgi:hypothetical protein
MGIFDDVKKSLVKKPSAEVPAEKPLPTRVFGVSEKTVAVLKKAGQARQNKYLGLLVDATASRGLSWDRAQKILRKIFDRLSQESGLHIRVVYFGGEMVGDLGWSGDLLGVQRRMAEVRCVAGGTQITEGLGKLFHDAGGHLPENVILIGDAFEEDIEGLKIILKKYRRENVRIFSFFEPGGYTIQREPDAEVVFKKIAKVTNGVFQEYREGVYLDDLLVAVAAFAAQGQEGLDKLVTEKSRAALTLKTELLRIDGKTGG